MQTIAALQARGVIVHHDQYSEPDEAPTPPTSSETIPPQSLQPTDEAAVVLFDTTPEGSRETGGLFIEMVSITDSRPDTQIEITIKTLPGATCSLQPVNPGTGTRSSRPTDKVKTADDQGIATWTWEVHRHVAIGQGVLEFTVELDGQQIEKHYVWAVS